MSFFGFHFFPFWIRGTSTPLGAARCSLMKMDLSSWVLLVSALGGGATLRGAPALPPLPPALAAYAPTSLLPPDLSATIRFREAGPTSAQSSAAWATDSAGSPVLRIVTAEARPKATDVNISWSTAGPLARGDVCLARFYVRTVQARQESGESLFNFQVQPVSSGERSLILPISVGPDWALIEIPFLVVAATPVAGTLVQFSFALLAQTVEIADIELWNFGDRTTTSALPLTRFTYAGREAGAAWREQALARIERVRTAPLTIRVTDHADQPLPGARVEARLAEPAFLFGSCVDARLLGADSSEAKTYRAKVVELFNTVTIDNGLKWTRWGAGPAQRAEALRAVEWINAQGLRLRGHALVWPGWKFSPPAVVNHPDRAAVLPGLIDAHIRDVVTATAGQIDAWDVVNEPVHERDYFATMPDSRIAEWFKLARACDPRPRLFINEYGMLNSRESPAMIEKYLALIERLSATGAPIEGVGVQGHVGRQVRAPADVLADLDLLARAKLPLHITEFDINTPDESLQADYQRDFLIACYSHPAVTGFIMWGFWQPRHWKPDAALFRADWTEKPNAAVWRELVLQRWRTRVAGVTDERGEFATRGHLGRYEVTVNASASRQPQTVVLTSEGASLAVKLP